MSQKEIVNTINSNNTRSEQLNSWLEKNIGSPSTWLGSTKPDAKRPIQGPPTRPDHTSLRDDQVETDTRFNPMKGFNVLGDLEKRLNANGKASGTNEVKLLGTPPVTSIPSGVQEVRVTNPNPPQINVNVSMVVNEATNAAAIAQDMAGEISAAFDSIQVDSELAGP